MNVLLVFVCIAAVIRCFVKNRRNLWLEKIFLLLLTLTFMASYFTFCVEYPHICTMNVRYIVPVLFAGLLFLAIAMQEWKTQKKEPAGQATARLPEWILFGFSAIWSVLSLVMFLILGTI